MAKIMGVYAVLHTPGLIGEVKLNGARAEAAGGENNYHVREKFNHA
jgi:hypothetical protein